MMLLLKAEFRKLFTIRSTYIILAILFLLIGVLAFWALGYKTEGIGSKLFSEAAGTGAQMASMFVAIIAVLLMTHEYRYNTIMYMLTASNSRSKFLAAKVITATVFAVVVTLAIMAFAVLAAWLGASLRDTAMAAQHVDWGNLLWRSLFFTWGYTMVGLLVAVLLRHVVGAIVVLFIVPSTVEGLLGLVLKQNAQYLPFAALERVVTNQALSPGKAALIFSAYLLFGWLIAWILFLRRDAN
jgi:ABC-type transport system involved in multi-copper enzyme maturation permease subunit